MLIKIDAAARRFGLANLVALKDETRRYYAADAPHLMIVVTHKNLVLGHLPGRTKPYFPSCQPTEADDL